MFAFKLANYIFYMIFFTKIILFLNFIQIYMEKRAVGWIDLSVRGTVYADWTAKRVIVRGAGYL